MQSHDRQIYIMYKLYMYYRVPYSAGLEINAIIGLRSAIFETS
jgi:hypothetical protein